MNSNLTLQIKIDQCQDLREEATRDTKEVATMMAIDVATKEVVEATIATMTERTTIEAQVTTTTTERDSTEIMMAMMGMSMRAEERDSREDTATIDITNTTRIKKWIETHLLG